MTEQPTTTYPPANNWNPPTTPPKKKRWFTNKLIWVPALALFAGIAMGAGTQPEPEVREVEKIVTKEVPVEKIVEVEKEVKVPVTPAACIEALDLAQTGFTYSSEAMGYMNDALQAAGRFDVAALEQANADLETLNPKIGALKEPMLAATTECRAAE